jgi:hypothetical protein
MNCDSCGQDTGINYGNGTAVLCSNCSSGSSGVQLMAKRPEPEPSQSPGLKFASYKGADYQTSIVVARIVSAIGWVTCAVAVLILFSAVANEGGTGAVALALALGVLIGGLILVIAGQTSRAVLDTANSAKQILQEIRKTA